MTNTKRFILPLSFAILGIALLLFSITTGSSLAASELNGASLYAGSSATQATFPVVADFENGAPAGWFNYGGQNPTTNIITGTDSQVLDVAFNVTGFGGFGAILSDTLGQRDWSGYNAISFDFTGTNSGTEYKFQIQDAEGGGALERWYATFTDDSTETKKVTLLFTDFQWNGYQEGGPTDDGLQVTDIEAWLFDLPLTSGAFKLDNVEVVNYTPPVFPIVADFEAGLPAGWFNYGGQNPTTNIITGTDSQVLDGANMGWAISASSSRL